MECTDHEEPAFEASALDHYEVRKEGLLQLGDLDFALTSLQKIDALYRLGQEKHSDKVEIARWSTLWFEVPGPFYDYLEMRQKPMEFQRRNRNFNNKFGHHAGEPSFSI